LLTTLPFSGMRVICVDAPTEASAATTQTTADDCEQICARHHHLSSDTTGSNCVLTADACALIAFASTVSIGPEQSSAGLTLDVSAAPADASRGWLEPELAHQVPPPKPQIF
jgi:hypothetical protein